MATIEWSNVTKLESKSYTCGHCGNPLASERGWQAINRFSGQYFGVIYICHHCGKPTFFDATERQSPGVVFGEDVEHISDAVVVQLYAEARKCTGLGAYTAAVLCCRKLLMHIAVSKGAKEGEAFLYYVDFLVNNHYVPPDAKGWVDHIRKKGNEANHQIVIMQVEVAHELISFIEMLLKLIYEFPGKLIKK